MNSNESSWRSSNVLPCGHEVHDPGQVHYCTYLSLSSLFRLHVANAGTSAERDLLHHDEQQFIAVHQVCELTFEQIIFELHEVIRRISTGQYADASKTIRRVMAWIRIVVQATETLRTMYPDDFAKFRNDLVPASGLESITFRKIEILSGLRADSPYSAMNSHVLTYRESLNVAPISAKDAPKTRLWTPELEALSNQASVQTVFAEALRSRGLSYEALYADEAAAELRELAEQLYAYEIEFKAYRGLHVGVVSYQIGAKQGTGNKGIDYLKSVVALANFFPELWEYKVRSETNRG